MEEKRYWEKEEEIGRIQVSNSVFVVVRRVEGFGIKGVLISKRIESKNFTGWKKGGLFVPVDKVGELVTCLSKSMIEER